MELNFKNTFEVKMLKERRVVIQVEKSKYILHSYLVKKETGSIGISDGDILYIFPRRVWFGNYLDYKIKFPEGFKYITETIENSNKKK